MENRLEAVCEGGALLMAAAYDGDGNRVFQLNYNPTADSERLVDCVIDDKGDRYDEYCVVFPIRNEVSDTELDLISMIKCRGTGGADHYWQKKTLRSTELGAITALAGAGVSIVFTASGAAVAGNTVSVPAAVTGVVEVGVGLALTGYGMNSVGENFAKFTESLGVSKGSTNTNTLTDAQKSRLKALDNTINDHLTESDFSGALRDLQGDPVPNGRGGYFDHVGEMKDSYKSLLNHMEAYNE